MRYYFNRTPPGSQVDVAKVAKEDFPLIRAIAHAYHTKDRRLSCLPLLEYALNFGDNDHLRLLSPWLKTIRQEIEGGYCDGWLNSPIIDKLLHEGGPWESKLRRKLIDPLREAASKGQTRILEENMQTLLEEND